MGWQSELKENITSVEELGKHIKLNPREAEMLQKVVEMHPMSISRYYMSLINRRDGKDPPHV